MASALAYANGLVEEHVTARKYGNSSQIHDELKRILPAVEKSAIVLEAKLSVLADEDKEPDDVRLLERHKVVLDDAKKLLKAGVVAADVVAVAAGGVDIAALKAQLLAELRAELAATP